MSIEFRGKIRIETDEKWLSAKIHFTPISTANALDLKSLHDLLEKEGVVYGIDEEKLEAAAKEFSESMEPYLSDVIAAGTEAKAGTGIGYDFSPFHIPENIQVIADKIKRMNKAPVIYKTIKVSVNRDKRVKDKGLFKNSREKIVTVQEEEEKKIRVEVSPNVLDIGYFEEGSVICTISSSSGEETVGSDIRGNKLIPPDIVEGDFWTGNNILTEKTQIIAKESGFVRRGKNWLDLITFKNHKWTVRLSENKADCYIDIVAGHQAAPPPMLSDIKRAISELGVSQDSLLDDQDITQLLKSGSRSGGAQSFCLTRDKDGSYEIEINSLSTEAYLHLYKGSGSGNSLDLKQAWNAVLGLKIQNLEVSRVKKEILDFNRSDNKEISIFLARGEDPRRGDDREIVLEAEFLPEEEVRIIKDRIKDLKNLPPSFRDFPSVEIEKMAKVKKGMKLFHLGQQKGGKDGKDIFGNTIKAIEGNDPNLNFYENINMQDGVATSQIDGILDLSTSNSSYSLRVREHEDAKIIISLSDNNMTAYASFLSPQGSGLPISGERIKTALSEKGIIKGILEEEILKISQWSEEGRIVTDHPVAEGKIPFQGEQSLKFLVDIEPGKKDKVPVDQGDLIAELEQQGEDDNKGYNVLGEELYSENDKGLERESNVLQIEEEGKVVLKAGAKGLLCIENGRIYIKEKMSIRGDVNRTGGNIKFPGSIVISGSVLSGIFVNAGKDLTVLEVVEASLLSAGGSIAIGKGVKGERKAVLRAGVNISLGFAESTNLMVNGSLKVGKALMNCIVKCNGQIISEGDKTRIIGGSLKVKSGLTTGSLGSESEVKTLISFGQDYLVEDQINVSSKEIEMINEQLREIESHLKLAEEKRNQKKIMALRKKKVQILKILEKKGIKNFFLKEKFEIHYDSMIKVHNEIFPGVIFESHGRTLAVKEKLSSVIIYFDSSTGKINTKPLN